MSGEPLRAAAVVIPVLDEATHLEELLNQLLETAPPEVTTIWIVDGGSRDGSIDLAQRFARIDERVEVLLNPRRLQSVAVNEAARRAARSDSVRFLIRMDAHARYPHDFCSNVLARLNSSGADSVVVPMHTIGRNRWQDAGAVVFNHWIATGNSPHRVGGSGWVDHGHHAGFVLERFLELGGYDESFVANEDAEFDIRLRASGGRIYLEPLATIDYIPRSSPYQVFRQHLRNGRWRGRTLRRHRMSPLGRQLLPALTSLLEVLALSAMVRRRSLLPLAMPLAHVGVVWLVIRRATPDFRASAEATIIALLAHAGMGLGLLASILLPTGDRGSVAAPSSPPRLAA